MFNKKLICVTGLPRSGSTLLCQLLAHHPEIYCPGHTSPLLQMLLQLRQSTAENEILLAQLDNDPEAVLGRLMQAYRGFMEGWYENVNEPIVVEKNRSWLAQMDLAVSLSQSCKMLVCVREPGQILGSIEARHQKTLAIDFPEHLASYSPYDRANRLFAKDGVVGFALNNFRNAQDFSPDLQQRILCILFEDLVNNTESVMQRVWSFLDLPELPIDTNNLKLLDGESDSHYRMKYTHNTYPSIRPPKKHTVPVRIEKELRNSFDWFYRIFYPGT